MQTATDQYLPKTAAAHLPPAYPPLEQVTRPTVPTSQAAYYLNRQPQTLRSWASAQPAGVPRPVRISGRLAWKVSDIKSLLTGEPI
jgi:hypothetical protein